MGTDDIATFLDVMLSSMPALRPDLAVLRPLIAFELDVVRNKALGSGQLGAQQVPCQLTHHMEQLLM